MAKPFSAAGQMVVYTGTLTLSPPSRVSGMLFTAENTEVGVLGDDGLGDNLFAKLSFQVWGGKLDTGRRGPVLVTFYTGPAVAVDNSSLKLFLILV